MYSSERRPLAKLTPAQYSRLPEIATRQRDITKPWIAELDYPDDLNLRDANWDWSIYEALLRDDQVFSTFQQRRLAVVSREYEVVAGGDRRIDRAAADFISEIIAEPSLSEPSPQQLEQPSLVGFDALTDKMLYGRFWGFAVAEFMWARDGRFTYPEQIKVRKQRRFRFDVDGRARLMTFTDPYGIEIEREYPRKFWIFKCGGVDDDDPYAGNGLAPIVYWPVWFKRNGLKFWSIYLETASKPRTMGKHGPSASPSEIATLLQAADAVQQGAAVAIPDGMQLDLLEAVQRADTYEQFAAYWDRAIAKAILGQVMTSEAVGGQYKAEIQFDVRAELIKSDSDLVNGSANLTWVRWLTEWNFPGAAAPRIWRRLDDEPDLKLQAERDNIIVGWGYRPTPEYVLNTYGDGFIDQPGASEGQQGDPGGLEPSGLLPGVDVQDASLNGAQLAALLQLMQTAVAGQLPMESAVQLIQIALPTVSEERARALLSPISGFTAPTLSDPLPPIEPAEFAAPDNAVLPPTEYARRSVGRMAQQVGPIVAGWVDQIQSLLESSSSYEDFLARLADLYPELDKAEFARLFNDGLMATYLGGASEIQYEGSENADS